MNQVVKFDNTRIYTCRCPACKMAMNIPGITLNTEKHIRCWNCNALGRVDKWIQGGQICQQKKS
jgi:uncharacterized paraquat-inducible protein A